MRISPHVCRRLALVDASFRYGQGWIPGHGPTFFLAKLINGDKLQRNAEERAIASLAWDLHERLIVMYDAEGREVPSANERPGWVPWLMSWPGQAGGNDFVTTGSHAAWLEYNQKSIQMVAEDIRIAAIENGRELGSAVEETTDYAMSQSDFYAKKNWQTDTIDRTVTKEELREIQSDPRRSSALRRLQRTLDGLDTKDFYVQYRLWEQGLGILPKS